MTAQFSNNPLVWPLWLQVTLGSIAAAELVAFSITWWQFRPAQSARRIKVRVSQGMYEWRVQRRPAREAEDRYWADLDLRGREVLHARALTAQRDLPDRLLKAVH